MGKNLFTELKDKIPTEKLEEVKDKVEDFVSEKAKGISGDVTETISKVIKEKTGEEDIVGALKDKLNIFGGDNK